MDLSDQADEETSVGESMYDELVREVDVSLLPLLLDKNQQIKVVDVNRQIMSFIVIGTLGQKKRSFGKVDLKMILKEEAISEVDYCNGHNISMFFSY